MNVIENTILLYNRGGVDRVSHLFFTANSFYVCIITFFFNNKKDEPLCFIIKMEIHFK